MVIFLSQTIIGGPCGQCGQCGQQKVRTCGLIIHKTNQHEKISSLLRNVGIAISVSNNHGIVGSVQLHIASVYVLPINHLKPRLIGNIVL